MENLKPITESIPIFPIFKFSTLNGKTEWEYVNKYKDKVYILTWSRLIKDDKFIKNYKKKLKLNKC